MACTTELGEVVAAILNTPIASGYKARLVAISGIDSSGKGFIASKLSQSLDLLGAHVALIGIDGWLNLPPARLARDDPGRHFYKNAFRFDQMFSQLIDPLVRMGSIDLLMDFTGERADDYRKHRCVFAEVDTILLEGIFLFRRDLRSRYDLKVWIDCSFETALLQRAITRSQEGLNAEETIAAYQTIYFPAERVHLLDDDPLAYADFIFKNDVDAH